MATIRTAMRGTEDKEIMTSAERHEGRYQRRKAKRLAKIKKYDNFEEVFTYEHLFSAFNRSRQNIHWKRSVKVYELKSLIRVYKTFKELATDKFKSRDLIEFDLFERGKHRHISSVPFNDRIVQKCLCEYSLDPVVCNSFIYDNGS